MIGLKNVEVWPWQQMEEIVFCAKQSLFFFITISQW